MIKVCGMTKPEDVRLCAQAGVDLLGFIFHPASPRFVTPDFPASLEPEALGQARKVGVFVKETVVEVRHIMDEAQLDYVQLHSGQDPEFCRAVGSARVIKVFWPERYASLDELAEDMARFADCAMFLLDAGTSGGGHGRSLDFAALTELDSPRPWLLAGGLGPKNVRAAVEACASANLAGVDLNSGVESAPGLKDIEKVRTAIAACRR
ncbi:phosphoribosylanthranilate isomerase [Desulfocurvibacter africanus PCS]|uniref:N-(5'-phosphoribosyl)anthranilate isomerase n=1 Tax=Desulfocurvibacter africanus PCS TaxID=1262666 RepID=M5Q2Y1_DESAF|nr:phosphoribosylanthranilate isomerase [Desulfocurvibacter africanus]EMG37798.1 phosphoribosylanthranilate isomerase [Desulfocurvibacter africanus PCS]